MGRQHGGEVSLWLVFFASVFAAACLVLVTACPPSSDCEVLLTCGPADQLTATVSSSSVGGSSSGTGGAGSGAVAGQGGVGGMTGSGGDGGMPVDGFEVIAAGYETTCAIHTDGTAWCWGDNEYGQLGNGMSGTSTSSSTPVGVVGLSSVTDIDTENGSCAIAGGGLLCWGAQNGTGTPSNTPVSVGLGQPVADMSVGLHVPLTSQPFHSCVVLNDGTGRCWGYNSNGELGVDPQVTPVSSTPVVVQALSNATAISCGGGHTCALTGSLVRCWGAAVANSQSSATHTPGVVNGLTGPTMVAAGSGFNCARLSSGQVRCWGYGGAGQLGNGMSVNSNAPVTVSGLSGVVDVAAGLAHACAVVGNGDVWCWGDNQWGQLGNNGMDSNVPVKVTGLANAKSVTAGGFHSCAVLQDGRAFCWGNNQVGQLGNGSIISSPMPVEVDMP